RVEQLLYLGGLGLATDEADSRDRQVARQGVERLHRPKVGGRPGSPELNDALGPRQVPEPGSVRSRRSASSGNPSCTSSWAAVERRVWPPRSTVSRRAGRLSNR